MGSPKVVPVGNGHVYWNTSSLTIPELHFSSLLEKGESIAKGQTHLSLAP